MVMELSAQRAVLNSANNAIKEFKLVVVGPRKVGKSALVVRFLTKRFINEYLENTDMTCRGMVDVDGEILKVNIQDTSDKGMKLSSVDHHFRWADAIMLVYSITDADSYLQIKNTATKIMDKIVDLDEKESSRIPPLIVVGNKGDLDYVRKVTKQQGFELAEQLRCDFFEASAREGWSKLLSRDTSYNTSPCSENETLNVFAGTTAVIGLVGVTAQRRSSTPPPNLSRQVAEKCHRNSKESNEENGIKRWGSFRSVRKSKGHTRSQSNAESDFRRLPRINISESVSTSPSLSEESDENTKKSSSLLAPPKSRKSRHGIMGKLSPKLSRKFHKNHSRFTTSKDDNNNNSNSKSFKGNSIMNGLSSSLLMSTRLTDTMSTEPTTSSSTSSTDSVNEYTNENQTYNPVRRKSLPHTEQNFCKTSPLITNKDFISGVKCNGNAHMSTAERMFCSAIHPPHEIKLQEHEYSGSEPFIHLCRDGKFLRGRIRARSPSHLIRSGFKRIKSLASDQGQHVNQNKQNNLTLAVPSIRLS